MGRAEHDPGLLELDLVLQVSRQQRHNLLARRNRRRVNRIELFAEHFLGICCTVCVTSAISAPFRLSG
jgi:hypothetical protein